MTAWPIAYGDGAISSTPTYPPSPYVSLTGYLPAWPPAYSQAAISAVPAYVSPTAWSSLESEPIIFLSPYHSDRATIAASSEASVTTPAAAMQTIHPWQKWRSTEAQPTITIEFLRPIAANMLALVATNLLPGDLIKIEGANSLAYGELDTGYQPAWRTNVPLDQIVRAYTNAVRFQNQNQYRYWRVSFLTMNGQTYVEVGRLMLGEAVQPLINFAPGSLISFASPDAAQTSDYLYSSGDSRGLPVRAANLNFESVDQSELESKIMPLRQLRGLAGDVFVDMFPSRVAGWENTSMQARFKGTSDWTSTQRWNGAIPVWQTVIQLSEVAL